MKTFILIIMILGSAIISSAQEATTGITFEQKKFNTETITDSTEYFAISPKFKTDTSEIIILPFKKLPCDSFSLNNQGKIHVFANQQKPEFRMPVATGGPYYFNMPVAVPDSTVKYYIKNKHIDYINPLEKNFK
jgi:hypothetical protein